MATDLFKNLTFNHLIDDLSGLEPRACLLLGESVPREQVKQAFFDQGRALQDRFVISQDTLAAQILEIDPSRILSKTSRRKILTHLLSQQGILDHLPGMRRRTRQRTFISKVEKALSSARLCWTNEAEKEAIRDRVFARDLFQEFEKLSLAYEAWLEGHELWDRPLLLRRAVEHLEQGDLGGLARFEKIYRLELLPLDPLETLFRSLLENHFEVVSVSVDDFYAVASPAELPAELAEPQHTAPISDSPQMGFLFEPAMEPKSEEGVTTGNGASVVDGATGEAEPKITRIRTHSPPDAAEQLAQELAKEASKNPGELSEMVILIPDAPEIRKTLMWALDRHGIPLTDPRDPTALRWSETMKEALLPLRVVAGRFKQEDVLAEWRRARRVRGGTTAGVERIYATGARQGLDDYGTDEVLTIYLKELQGVFGKKQTLAELKVIHLDWLGRAENGYSAEVLPQVERVWNSLIEDDNLLPLGEKKAPLLFWLEQFKERLRETTPPMPKTRPKTGILLHRLDQWNLSSSRWKRVLFFLPPADLLDQKRAGDLWLSDSCRDGLSEFGVKNRGAYRELTLAQIKSWMDRTDRCDWVESDYDESGAEKESLEALMSELGARLVETVSWSYPERWVPSYSSLLNHRSSEVVLPTPERTRQQVSVTTLETYSRCHFMGLGWSIWKLRDPQASSSDLLPQYKGQILHRAVERLMILDKVQISTEEIERELSVAWEDVAPKGLIRSRRVQEQTFRRFFEILEKFLKKEQEYREKSPVQILDLEKSLELRVAGTRIVGIPDRVDQTQHGLLVMDYKSSAALPQGREILDLRYRMQMPFYALAAQKKWNQPIAGCLYVELTKTGTRSKGILFDTWNGKAEGAITSSRSKKSLFSEEPEELWARFDAAIELEVTELQAGHFSSEPKKSDECDSCRVRDLCGERRRPKSSVEVHTP